MPEGPAHWHEFWDGDEKPCRYLESRGYRFTRGGDIVPPAGQQIDSLDLAALNYLAQEWDYSYSPEPTPPYRP